MLYNPRRNKQIRGYMCLSAVKGKSKCVYVLLEFTSKFSLTSWSLLRYAMDWRKGRSNPPAQGRRLPFLAALLYTVTLICSVDGQTSCYSEICSESGFGLYCAEGGVLHINHVSCGHHDPESCSVAKHNLMTMCTGQKSCAASILRKILRPCQTRPWSSVYVRVNYSCVPEAILTRTCSGDMEEEIGNRGAIIMSPNYPDSPTDVRYNFCHWAFSVPVWQNARLSIQHLTSRQNMGRCDSPLLQLRYTLCNGGGVKTEKYCGVIKKEKVRRACGRVHILARGFDPQYDAGTKFLLSVNVDYPQNLDERRGNPMYTIPCGGQPTTATPHRPKPTYTVPLVDLLSLTTQGGEQQQSDGLKSTTSEDSSNQSSPKKMSRTLKVVLVLTLTGIIIIGLIAAIVVVCHKTVQSGNYKLREAEALAIARRRSREPEPTKFDHVGMNGHRPGKCSIEDLDEDLIINGLRDDRCENSPTKQHYMTIDEDDTTPIPNGKGGNSHSRIPPDVVDHTYSSYASIDDDASALTSLDSGYPRAALYEDLDTCKNGYIPPPGHDLHGDCDSLDEYDNVPSTADVLADVEHYNVDGDDYAVVTKPRRALPKPAQLANNGPRHFNGGVPGINGGFHVTPKPVYVNKSGNVVLLDTRINNHRSLGDEGEIIY